MTGRRPLISAAELATVLDEARTVVVDCRFTLTAPAAGREAFLGGHIPGARYANLDQDLARPPSAHEGRHPLPEPEVFAETLGAWGITSDSRVVAYDDQAGAIAARLWWMLGWLGHVDVAVLDGGIQAWIELGHELARGAELPVEPREYRIRALQNDWIATTAEIETLDRAAWRLVDARSQARYDGREEPIDPVAGHVPGAVNWPFIDSVGGDGRLRSRVELNRRLERMGIGADEGIIAMCGSGVTACHLLLVLAELGHHGRLYAGSWSEWIRDPRRPIVTSN